MIHSLKYVEMKGSFDTSLFLVSHNKTELLRDAERMNQTIIEKVRCILSQVGLSKTFWAEALSYAVHLVNRLPVSGNGGKTPLEVCQVLVLVIVINCMCLGVLLIIMWQTQSGILEQKKAKFMGFSKGVKSYRLWCLETSKIVNSRDVTFDESGMFLQKI